MCLNVSGYYCQGFLFFFFFFGKGCIQNEEPNSKREYGCNVFMWFKEKDEKYLAFLTALTFHEDYDLDKKKKKKKRKSDYELQERTELQAALVCTVTKRCSLGNHSTPTQANYEKHKCNSGKVQSQQRDHSPKLTGWHKLSAVILPDFQSEAIVLTRRVMKSRGVNNRKDLHSQISDYQ